MIETSHEFNLVQTENNLLWSMNGIHLQPEGKGYITFRVKPKSGYAIGDIIPNTAYIYFDFNPPIITNTYTTEFISTMNITDFDATIFTVYPNPTKDFLTISSKNSQDIKTLTINDMSGKTIFKDAFIGPNKTIDISQINNGIYFLSLSIKSQKNTIKFIKQ